MDRQSLYFNNNKLKQARVLLRQKSTIPENILWNILRRKNTGDKWYRQYSVGKFILDFYCPKKKLAIEIDGQVHKQKSKPIYDQNRSYFLMEHGIIVKRFWNKEVLDLKEKILELI